MDSYPLLEQIKSPADVKALPENELPQLAEEARRCLISTVSQTGGHLASNLGVVELTIALHRVFNSPHDKIVWDVGHQIYTHKLLTGRFKDFGTLRQDGGISGFSNPAESEHDPFYSGHASVSVSAAYGIARANLIRGRKNYTIAVVGDGAFTGGEIFEGLNNAGGERTRLIVILNDNEMSISENVGSLANHLAVIKARPSYFRTKARIERGLNLIPLIGVHLSNGLFRLKTTLKRALYKNSTMFEELGFRYMGPVDGHNIPVLCDALEAAKTAHYPILLHIKTTKGKGYEYAESDPALFHGISRFDIETGEFKNSRGFSNAFGDAICDFAEKDARICAVTAAMAIGTGLDKFSKKFPDRFFDVGIAEQHAVTFCSGLAKGGMVPVFAVYSAFLQRAYDQLVHDVALQKLKVIICVDRCGFVTGDGETHHGLLDVPMLNTIPDVIIYSPADYAELSRCLYRAIYKDPDGIIAVRLPKGCEPDIPEDLRPGEGDCDVFVEENAETSIVTYGRVYAAAAAAYRKLDDTKLIKLNRIKPIDPAAVSAALTCKRVFFFEESERSGGAGEEFGYLLSKAGFKGEFILHAVENKFVPQSEDKILLHRYGFDEEGIIDSVLSSKFQVTSSKQA
ncbi:MAG: 1-deoxy-D-xylulose-5-phosphate synthase [Clostridia bacterium]|nr:1-deoxy-D-xylulose-5-phosphate synthase [Clostridia bacterium]